MLAFLYFVFCLQAYSTKVEVTKDNISLDDSFYYYAESENDFEIEGLENFDVISVKSGNKKDRRGREYKRKIFHLKPKREGDFHLKASGADNVLIHVIESIEAPDSMVEVTNVPKSVYKHEKFCLGYNLLSFRELAYAKFRRMKHKDLRVKHIHLQDDIQKCYKKLKRYNRYFMEKLVCSSNKSGTIEIPSRTVDVEILDRRSDCGHFFPAYVKSSSFKIEVKELPGKAVDVIGRPNISFKLHNNDSFSTISIVIYGDANLDNLHSIYESTESYDISEDVSFYELYNNGYEAKKIFDIKIIPKSRKGFIIPPKEIEYFDTKEDKYKVLKIPELDLMHFEVDENNSIFNNLTKGRSLLYVILVVLLYFLIRYAYFFIFRNKLQEYILKVAKLKAENREEIFDILAKAVMEERGINIYDSEDIGDLTEEIEDIKNSKSIKTKVLAVLKKIK